MLALGQWAGQETPLFPGQPAVFPQLVVIWEREADIN